MHAPDVESQRTLMTKLSAHGMSMPALRDLVEYWGRRKFEGRPHDWT